MRTELTEQEKADEKAVVRLFVNAITAILFGGMFLYYIAGASTVYVVDAFASATTTREVYAAIFGTGPNLNLAITISMLLSAAIAARCVYRGLYWYRKL